MDRPNLERQQWAERLFTIQGLKQAPGWDVWEACVDDLLAQALDNLFSGTKETFDFHKGVAEGIRTVLDYPEMLKRVLDK